MNVVTGTVVLSGMLIGLKMWCDLVDMWKYKARAEICFQIAQEINLLIDKTGYMDADEDVKKHKRGRKMK